MYNEHLKSVQTIYIGGGTPSMLNTDQLVRILKPLKNLVVDEFTIEINPDSYTKEKGLIFKEYGINRVSIGVQTFNEELLKYVNRKHSNQMVFDCISHLKEIGIKNISVDLIYAIPGQTVSMLEDDLKIINDLDIQHVSCYSLILEENTYFYHQYKHQKFKPIDEDLEALMFEKTISILQDYGYEHYEVSNFCKKGSYSQHNLLYWTLDEYLGLGQGAHGFYNNYRTYNHRAMPKYYEEKLATKVLQTKEDLMSDYMIFGLRKIKGINILDFNKRFDEDLMQVFPEIQDYLDNNMLKIVDDNLMLTKKGLFLGNQVFGIFI